MTAAIQAQGLSYTYPDGTHALENIDLQVRPGECLGLVGPSGAGKSTLALCLLGLIFPQQGQIAIYGINLSRKQINESRKKVGLIFQNPDDQLFMPTLFDDVAFGLLQNGVRGEEMETRVKKALCDRGIEKLAHKFPGHLSGGQKRLAALAAVLVMEPEVLVLDEPSSNLDPRARRRLIEQLDTLENTRLIMSHDLEMILDLADRVALLSNGKLVSTGTPAALLGNAALMADHGLEVPHSLLPHRPDLHPHRIRRGKTASS